MFSVKALFSVQNMKLNERSLAQFAVSSAPLDKEGYLNKKGELNRGYQRRWFVLKGNLFYYFEREGDKEAIGVVILENCHVELAESEDQPYAFQISYGGAGARTYILGANSSKEMESWMKALSNASYAYLKMMVEDLERRLHELTETQNEMVTIGLSNNNRSVTPETKNSTERPTNITEGRLSFSKGITTNHTPSDSLGKFEPSSSVGTLIELDNNCDSDMFSIQKYHDDLLPINFNEFKHLQALHTQEFGTNASKSTVSQDDSSLIGQRLGTSLGKPPRSKSERRRNHLGTHVSESGQFQAFTRSIVDETYDLTDQVSIFRYLHNTYGASIWVKVKECGKKDLL